MTSHKNQGILFFSLMIVGLVSAFAATTTLNGSGATFPAPLYQRWAVEFHRDNPLIMVNYQGVGSGAGVADFKRGLTDFCATDVLVHECEIEKMKDKVFIMPLTAGMIVLSFNIPGVTTLRLRREAYLGIFSGKITQWDDPLIATSNPGVVLPALPITVVTRSDGSGTTSLFTEHLAAVSPEFNDQIGSGKSVKWPVGLAGKGNDGVTSLIKRTRGALGYVEFGFAKGTNLPMASLENKAGAFVAPTEESGSISLKDVAVQDHPCDLALDPAGAGDYPITGFTWVFLKKEYSAEKRAALQAFMTYALTTGQSLASSLGYLPLPAAVVEQAQKALAGVATQHSS